MYLELGPDGETLGKIYESGDMSDFLAETTKLFIMLSVNSGVQGRVLFEPSSDARLEDLSNWLARPSKKPPQADLVLHIATELYMTGGHTRVLEDIVRAMPDRRHVVIITDILGAYSRNGATLGPLEQRFNEMGIEIRWLPQGDVLNRVVMLITMVSALSPGAIFINAHPFDTVAYAAISSKSAPRVLLLHHADFGPALGSSRHDYTHVDLTDMCHAACCNSRLHEPKMLSMTVEDRGVITPDYTRPLVGVTSGSFVKFEGNVGSTYAELLAAVLIGGVQTMHHIGALKPEQIEEIHQVMKQLDIHQKRVVFHGEVPSLALKLKELQPSFVLNSHPIGGGKASIEALSLGLPIMHYSPPEKLPRADWVDSMGGCIRLRHLAGVREAVVEMEKRGAEIGKANRALYERRHTMAVFAQTLRELTAF